MRLWSIHPKYLDAKGLVALWRETLLAQAVLQGQTRGYKHHPQLDRFKATSDPAATIASYLLAVWHEATDRGYRFDKTKIGSTAKPATPLTVTRGQLLYEFEHLKAKLVLRDPERLKALTHVKRPAAHPLLKPKAGGIEAWEVL